ncbi:MAG: PP2C family serine/threonine-protein phosphatase, partial [Pseudomonadota bacterium]
ASISVRIWRAAWRESSLGSSKMSIEVGPSLRLKMRDTVVLGSDGLFDNLRTEEIVERVRKGPLLTAGERLQQSARRRMATPHSAQPSKPDDLTFLLFRRGPAKKS